MSSAQRHEADPGASKPENPRNGRHLAGVARVAGTPRRLTSKLLARPSLVVPQQADDGLHVYLYDAERKDGHVSLEGVRVDELTADQLLWVDVAHEQDIDLAAAAFGLAAETIARIREPSTQPALFVHDGYVHVVVVAPGSGPLGYEPHSLDCVVGLNWVLTVHRQPIGFLGHFDDRIRGDSDLGRLDGHGFLAAILHEHVASYLAELRPIEAEIDRLDVRSMTGRADEDALLHELVGTRLRVAKLRRLLEPHRDLHVLLGRSEFAVLSGSEAAADDFHALTEFLERTLHSMESTREMIIGSFEIYTTWTAHGTNRVMKRLTVASLTLLPPTLIAGVMGMNSLPDPFVSTVSFWITTVAMIVVSVTVLGWMRKWI
jgi:Mg2+ and Co2+ transporter CorA